MADDDVPRIPFRPVPRDFEGFPMPPTVPPGLRLELSRSRVVDGHEDELQEWMTMLTDRYDEAVAALPAERAVFEATFRHREADGSLWIYHLTLTGEDGGGLDESNPIDAAHAAYSRRVKEPGWEEIEPMFMLAPDHLRDAMRQWGETGAVGDLSRDTLLTLETLPSLEERGWGSLCDGTGGAFYGDLMTDDSLMILVNGTVLDRNDVVASLDEAPTWDRFAIREPRLLPAGVDAAALVYRAEAVRGDEPAFEALMSSTYALVDGTPRLALYQQTTATH